MATHADNDVDLSKPKPNAYAAQAIITSLNVAPAPQNQVVIVNESCPSGSFHNFLYELKKSFTKNQGFFLFNL